MLVQLSPWQTCSTSVPVSTKRRRKRSDASENGDERRPLEFEASFVTASTARRHRNKKRHVKNSNQEEPMVAITSTHRVSIVGRSLSRQDLPSLQECSQWQFRSRPGRTTSFVLEEKGSNGSSKALSRVPAIMDARNDKVYALQNDNGTLSCWDADSASGPDDVDLPAVKVELSKPAVSLSNLLFQKGVAYGTCQDGTLFVARWTPGTDEKETLRVEYSDPAKTKGTQHVCTIVQSASCSEASRAGQKRKASHEGDFVFYQVFSKSNGVLIYRHEVNLMEDDCLDGSNVQASFVDLKIEDMSGLVLVPASISASRVDDSTIAIVYAAGKAENGKSKEYHQQFYCAPVVLETGRLMRTPFGLANLTRHAGAVTPFLLAVGTLDEILLYDIAHGAIVHRAVVTDLVGDCKNWSLITEARKGRIALLSVQNSHAHVCFAKATLDKMSYHKALEEGNGYSLAVGLRSSLASPSLLENASIASSHKNLLEMVSSMENEDSERLLDVCVKGSLARLRACIDEIQDPENLDIQPYHFMNEYERSVINILSATPRSSTAEKKKRDSLNGHKKILLANGVHHAEVSDSTQDTEATSTASKHEEMNGSADCLVNGLKIPDNVRGYTPSSLPQRFVDGATSIVLSVLQLPYAENKGVGIRSKLARLDARLILTRLIRTGKVSARRHFDSSLDHGRRQNEGNNSDCFFTALRSLKLTKKGNRRVFSPVDLMHDMLTWCPDISEGHLVTMIHFMLCKALPEDIAENILDHGNLQPGHPYRVLAKRFVQVRSALRKQQAIANVGKEEVSQLKEQEESLSMNLIRAGISMLVGRLVLYSRCNETLLRNAMCEGLIGTYEPVILSRVLVELLNDEGKDALAAKQQRPSHRTALLLKWIFALCEACRERLVASDDTTGEADGESPLSQVLDAVRAKLKNTEAVMTLHDMVYHFGATKSNEKDDETREADKLAGQTSHNREATPVPPYSIERLAF